MPFWKFQKFSKINSNFKILVHHFFRLCILCIVKKFRLDSNKTDGAEEIHFEVFPYGDSGNGIAAAARHSPGYCNWTGGAAACSDRSSGVFRTAGIRNWGRNRAVKTHRLVCLLTQIWKTLHFAILKCIVVLYTGVALIIRLEVGFGRILDSLWSMVWPCSCVPI